MAKIKTNVKKNPEILFENKKDSSLEYFLKNKNKALYISDGNIIFTGGPNQIFVVKGREVFGVSDYYSCEPIPNSNFWGVGGLLFEKNKKNIFIGNADDFLDYSGYSSSKATVSVACVKRLFDLKSISKQVYLVDFTEERTKNASKEEIRHAKDTGISSTTARYGHKNKGYSIINRGISYVWHMPSTVVLKYTNRNKTVYGLFGQDEGTYFGCILPGPVKTVDEAFKILMPKCAINKEYIRQGEWFAIKVKKPNGPEYSDIEINLPVENGGENTHNLTACQAIISKDDLYVSKFSLTHPEHGTILDSKNNWYLIKRNTAVYSVSQEGVD
jgi:hypothetical protein